MAAPSSQSPVLSFEDARQAVEHHASQLTPNGDETAALLAAAFTAFRRRHRVPVSPGNPGHWLVARVLTAVTIALLLAVTGASAIVLLPHDWMVWQG